MATTEEMLKQMYASNIKAQKDQLAADRDAAQKRLEQQQAAADRKLAADLTRTAVEANKAERTQAELESAYGLSSGARGQARISRDNQLQSDLTALRNQKAAYDNDLAGEMNLLSQQYESAIRKAQADNDRDLAEALYKEAKDKERQMRAAQEAEQRRKLAEQELAMRQAEAAAKLMAQHGDYTRYGNIYGLSPEEIARLQKQWLAKYGEDYGEDYGEEDEVLHGNPFTESPGSLGMTTADFFKYQMNKRSHAPGSVDTGGIKGIDFDSLDKLGYRDITPQQLRALVESGDVEEYVENGYLKYRKRATLNGGTMYPNTAYRDR